MLLFACSLKGRQICLSVEEKPQKPTTKTPPNKVSGLGVSSIPSQTYKGPKTVSNSIIKLTLAADVSRDSFDSKKKKRVK